MLNILAYSEIIGCEKYKGKLIFKPRLHSIYSFMHLIYNLYIKEQHVFLLRNDNLYSFYTFQIKSSLI